MKLPLKPLLLALGAAATLYALVLVLGSSTPPTQILRALASPAGLVAAALCALNYVLRGLRWRRWMAHYGRPLAVREGLRIYLAGYTFTPTPGNIGEAARGLLLARQPLGPAESLAIFGAERLADLLALVLLSLPAVGWLALHTMPGAGLVLLAAGAAVLSMLAVGAALYLWRRPPDWLARYRWLQQAWHCLASKPLAWLSMTLAAWAAQGVATWLICRELGLTIDPLLATAFYALAMVGGALSMLPAGLGGMEALLTALLVTQGATLSLALAITVPVRLLTLWLAVAIGVLALLYSAAIRKDVSLR